MKSILFFILFSCLGISYMQLHAQEPDSLHWQKADREYAEGKYKEAVSLYLELIEEGDSIFADINKRQVEDLRERYSIDEVELQSNIQQNKLLRLSFAVILCFITITVIGFFYLRRERRKLQLSRERLKQAKLLVEESMRNKSIFLSNMSHEIKTPLNALVGFLDILTMPEIDTATKKQCNDVIQLNSELLLKLVNDVVDISCIDLGNMDFRMEKVEVVSLCRSVIASLDNIKQTSAALVLDSDFSSLEIETDCSRLQQLLINLLVNATKFTKQGTITLKIEKVDDKAVQFSVTDTGCGIPIEQQQQIFGRFEKLHENVQGSGLGLSICKLIIKRLGGDVWIDPLYTQGARFVFIHPLKQEVIR